MSRTVKCNRCRVWRMPSDFISNDRSMKCCSKCRVVANAQSKKYRDGNAEKIKKYRDDHTEQSKKYRDDHTEQSKKYREDHTEQSKKYREEHKEHIREQDKKYYEKNAEQISEYKKKYYEKNTEQLREYKKKYYEKNAEQILEQHNKYYEDQKITNPLNTKFKVMIHNSIKSDTKSNRLYDPQDYIDEDFLNYVWNDQGRCCYHCNCEMTLDFNTNIRNPTQISVQRLDNDLPHLKSNCVLSCLSCNVKRKELIRV